MSGWLEEFKVNHADVYKAVKDAGYVRLVAEYDGGNDEGGAQSVSVVKADGEQVQLDGWEHPLWQLADRVLSERYYRWAGDFHAFGTIIIDAEKGTITWDGQESAYNEMTDSYE